MEQLAADCLQTAKDAAKHASDVIEQNKKLTDIMQKKENIIKKHGELQTLYKSQIAYLQAKLNLATIMIEALI